MEQYIYKVGFMSPECSNYLYFKHKELFTKSELFQFVEDVFCEVLEAIYKEQGKVAYDHGGPKFAELIEHPQFEEEMNLRGFVTIKPHMEAVVFGWIGAFQKRGWEDFTNEDDIRVISHLCDKFKTKGEL